MEASSSSFLFLQSKEPSLPKSPKFFNQKIPLSELKEKSESDDLAHLYESWNQAQKSYQKWVSLPSPKISTPLSSKSLKFPFLLSPPPGFENIKPTLHLSDLSTESEISPTLDRIQKFSVVTNDIKLQPAPCKASLAKRHQRGTYNEEYVSENRVRGEVKFYQLKKRFGFVSLEEDKSDVFLCEDDLIISGVQMKKFKEAVFSKERIELSFLIKHYYENSVFKRKAIEVSWEGSS